MKYRLYSFRVAGALSFPVDMLRYDACWPRGQEDVTTAFTQKGSRVVGMSGICSPTTGRWESFGWTVSYASHRTVEQLR